MIIFIYGPDTYRSRQKLHEIINYYKKNCQKGLNLKYFDCGRLNFQDFDDEFKQHSMFKDKKLIILENPFSNPNFKRKFLENSEKFINSKDIILFYETNQIPVKDSLFKFLKTKTKSQEFQFLEGEKLRIWAKKEFEKYRYQVSETALARLIEFIGNDLWWFSNEVKKLVSYKKFSAQAQEKKIEIEDVELLVKPRVEADIFKTIDALAQKNKNQALFLIHKHLEKGDNPLYLISMINFQFRNLLIIKDLVEKQKPYSVILKTSGLHPFVARKSFSLANKFTFQELKKIYRKIFQVDLDIKTGRIDPQIALDLLIAEI